MLTKYAPAPSCNLPNDREVDNEVDKDPLLVIPAEPASIPVNLPVQSPASEQSLVPHSPKVNLRLQGLFWNHAIHAVKGDHQDD